MAKEVRRTAARTRRHSRRERAGPRPDTPVRRARRRCTSRRRRRRQHVDAAGRHRREAVGDQGPVAEAGFRARDAGDAGQLARHGHPRPGEEAARDLPHRGGAGHAPPVQRIREARHREGPDVGELRDVGDLAGNHQHRGLQLVHRPAERHAVRDPRIAPQIRGRHLPLGAQHPQDAPGRRAQPPRFLGLGHAPDGVETRDEIRRHEHRLPARQLRVVDLAAPHELVLQQPGLRRLRILLHVARHHRVAAAADGDVE